MHLDQLKSLNHKLLNNNDLDELKQNENIIMIECNGRYDYHYNMSYWFTLYLVDDTDIQIYVKVDNK